MKKKGRKILSLVLALLMIVGLAMPSGVLAPRAKADAGDPPQHDKIRTDNGDGTFKIELSVTGDADVESESDTHINVLLIYDESSSMTNGNPSRADQAEDAMYRFVNGLVGYQARGVDIYMAEVGFGTGVNTRSNWTNSLTTIRSHFDEGASDGTITNSSHGNYNYNGTNWEQAFDRADTLLSGLSTAGTGTNADRSGYPTFVILVTDGGPTASTGNNTTVPGATVPWTSYRPHYLAAVGDARAIQNRSNTTLYGIYAFGTDANLLDDLMYYANTGTHRTVDNYSIQNATQQQHDFGEDEGADYYYTAANATALNAAIDAIFNEIVEAMGITNVSMSDGTTSEVSTTSGKVSGLLGVDEDSYQYWMNIPVENNQFTRKKNVNGSAETITYTVNGGTVTWTEGGESKSITLNGSVNGNQFKFEWTADETREDKFPNDFYEFAPNDAELVDGAVEWDLSNVGVLLDGVTYSVTFNVYPGQTALDWKARLDNGEAYTDVVPEDVRDYFDESGNLQTNTEGSVTYSDSRDGSGPTKTEFTNPPAVSTSSSSLTVKKEWEGASAPSTDLSLDVLMDGDEEHPFYTAKLNSAGGWEAEFNISAGMIVNGEVLAGAKGHDFTFAELDDTQYRWELHAPTVRPMIIDGADEPTILIKEDLENGYDSNGKTKYTIDGATYYVDPAVTTLTATNHRRSNLNLTKVVTGENAPDTAFPFTLKVNNAKAPDTEPTDDPEHNSDYWVWFSIYDTIAGETVKDAAVGNATPAEEDGEPTGYYYAKSGDEITVELKNGWNLRFTNLPSGSTYTFTEGDAANFKFISAANTGPTDDTFTANGKTATGTIVTYDAKAYEVTFTNDYALVDVTVEKAWEDNSNEFSLRPGTLTLTLNGAPTGTTVPTPTITGTDGDTWTYTWTGLPKYDADGNEITYTVIEEKVPEGYSCEETEAEDGGTITNTLVTGSLKITKTIEGLPEGESPEGLIFTISGPKDYSAEIEYKDLTNGSITIEDLPVGEYTVAESNCDYPHYTLAEDTVTEKKVKIEDNEIAEAAFTNVYTQNPGSLKITKTIEGLPEGEFPEELTFTVSCPETKFSQEVAYTEFEDGEYLLTDLTPGSYTVTESDYDYPNYTLADTKTEITVDVASDETAEAAFSNVYAQDVGSLTITKTITGLPEGAAPEKLTFTVSCPEVKYSREVPYTEFEDGKYVLTNLPVGEYTVTESGCDYPDYTLAENTPTSASAVVEKDKTAEVAFTNAYSQDVGSLTITKTITGLPEGAAPEKLTFTVTGPDGYSLTVKYADFTNGSTTINGLPVGEYTVTESGYDYPDYTLAGNTPTSASAVVEKDKTAEVAFTNAYSQDVGSLTITKTITGLPEGEFPEALTFTVTGPNGYSSTVKYADFTNGSTTIKGLPVGEYTVTESSYDYPTYYLLTGLSVTEQTVTVPKGGEAKAELKNAYETAMGGGDPVNVYYDGNGGTGTVTDENNPYESGVDITLLPNGFTREGYDFVAWNLAADGSDATYHPGDIYRLEMDTTFYALWAPTAPGLVKVIYDANGGTGTVVDPDSPYAPGTNITVESDQGISREGWHFVAWNLEPDGSGDSYHPGDTYLLEKDTTFYALWETDTAILKITKTASGATVPDSAKFVITGTPTASGVTFDPVTVTYAEIKAGTYALTVPAGTYTVTEDRNSASLPLYTLYVSGDNGTAKEVPMGATVTFGIVNRYVQTIVPPPTPPEPPVLNKKDHFAYIIGDNRGLVEPEASISRAEVATIFFRLLTDESRDQLWTQANGFSDVELEDWYNNAVSTMARGGIIVGYPDGTFRPNASITRAEFATMAVRFFRDNQIAVPRFTDVAGHWAEQYIYMAAEKGLIVGYPDNTFRPDAPITRAEAMTIINRLLERHPHKDRLLQNMIRWPDNMNPNAWYYAEVQEATNSHIYVLEGDGFENWQALLPVRDWAAFEKAWSTAHSAPNPGDVVNDDLYESAQNNVPVLDKGNDVEEDDGNEPAADEGVDKGPVPNTAAEVVTGKTGEDDGDNGNDADNGDTPNAGQDAGE